MDRISWDHWRSFLAVVDERSLSGAARSLGLTQPTLGRHVDALESALGAGLFLRVPSGLIATDIALALVPEARAMAASAASLRRQGSETTDGGTVRLAASEVVGTEVLPPVLARLAARHPRIDLELVLSNRNQDLLRNEADLAIRMVRPTQNALVAKALGRVRLGLYAHPDYLKGRVAPLTLPDLAEHRLIGPESGRGLAGVMLGGKAVTPDWFAHRTDSDLAQLALVRAGIGIGICQVGLAAGLVAILPDRVGFTFEPWLVMHEDLRASRRVRLLYDHLALELGAIWRG